MAKRKKSSHRKTHRRRRVGAINMGFDIEGMGLAIGGAVAARILTTKLAASTNATMQKAAPYSGLILGLVLPMLIKNNLVKQLSLGLIAGGGVSALGSTGLKVISGFENSISGVGYPYYYNRGQIAARPLVNGIGNSAGNQGLMKGTRSNFSGSRNSQMNTIAGIGCADDLGSGMN